MSLPRLGWLCLLAWPDPAVLLPSVARPLPLPACSAPRQGRPRAQGPRRCQRRRRSARSSLCRRQRRLCCNLWSRPVLARRMSWRRGRAAPSARPCCSRLCACWPGVAARGAGVPGSRLWCLCTCPAPHWAVRAAGLVANTACWRLLLVQILRRGARGLCGAPAPAAARCAAAAGRRWRLGRWRR